MKVSLKRTAILLGCAVAAALFASCSKAPVEENNHPAVAVAEYAVTVNDEMLEALVVSVEYYDADGTKKTEILTGPWSKQVESRLPAYVGARLHFAVKDGFDPSESETIRLSYRFAISCGLYAENGTKIEHAISYSNSSAKTIKTDRLAEWVSHYAQSGIESALYFITAPDGHANSIGWE